MFLIPTARRFVPRARSVYFTSDFDRLFDEALASVLGTRSEPAPSAPRTPALNLSESEAAYTVTAELPGVAKQDIKVSIDGRKVTLQAQAQSAADQAAGQQVLRRERPLAGFSRSFTLPIELDAAASQAKLDNGVLTLTLAKKQPAAATELAIN